MISICSKLYNPRFYEFVEEIIERFSKTQKKTGWQNAYSRRK